MNVIRHPLQRYYGYRDLHFVTFSCYHRQKYLDTISVRNHFVKVLDEVRSRYQFALLGYVVMPEHVHLLISEPSIGDPSKVLQALKQAVSRVLRQNEHAAEESSAFWQRRFYDFNVWSKVKLQEKLSYMHRNPVTRGLVDRPEDWPWSSWSHYAKGERGLIAIDPPR